MFGVITIAHGPKRYIDMAINMAISLKFHNPSIQCAIVTDVAQETVKEYFDYYIPIKSEYGLGLNQKLYLHEYSPFEETLFIDADCLVVKPLTGYYSLCIEHDFVILGSQINSGEWYMDVSAMCKRFNVSDIPLFNGGTYYFKKGAITNRVYADAIKMIDNYQQLGFAPFRGGINEEPLVSVSMALNGIKAVEDPGFGMSTPIGIVGVLEIDCLLGKSFFNKQGENVNPSIVHFCGAFANGFHYKREVVKLRLIRKFPFLKPLLISLVVNSYKNAYYASLVFVKRVAKRILRKEKFDFNTILPVYSNH